MRGRFRENDWPLSMKTTGRFQRSQLAAFNDHVQIPAELFGRTANASAEGSERASRQIRISVRKSQRGVQGVLSRMMLELPAARGLYAKSVDPVVVRRLHRHGLQQPSPFALSIYDNVL
jgi:hypothetical protein